MKLRPWWTAVTLAALPLLSSACGSSSSHGSSAGAKVFASARCADCHTLSAAGATGQVGPNLDLVKPDARTVEHQVRVGGNGMPAFAGELTARQIQQVASFVATAARNSGSVVAFKPDGTTIADCEKKLGPLCFRQAFGNLAFNRGPQIALEQLDADSRTIPGVQADCHQISHWLGHASLAYYHGNAAEALAHGGMTCSSGYYHGVIELSLSGLSRDRVIRIARRLCTGPSVTRADFLLYQCVHGLGHGLMIYSGDDLPYSLHVCDLLTTKFSRVSCTGGVFMQNLDRSMVASRYVKPNDPIYPCNRVARRHKVYCYLQVTERILQVVGYNWARVAGWCRRSEPGWVATCFQSFGRDASGYSQYRPEQTLRHCLEAGNMAGECIYGAARGYANNFAGGREAARLCNLAPERYRARCYQGIGTILGALHRFGPERRAACAAVSPPRYLADCLRGAAVT